MNAASLAYASALVAVDDSQRISFRTEKSRRSSGVRRYGPPGWAASSSTTCATSTLPASSRLAAMSSPSSARSVTPKPPRRLTPTPTCGLPLRTEPARPRNQSWTHQLATWMRHRPAMPG